MQCEVCCDIPGWPVFQGNIWRGDCVESTACHLPCQHGSFLSLSLAQYSGLDLTCLSLTAQTSRGDTHLTPHTSHLTPHTSHHACGQSVPSSGCRQPSLEESSSVRLQWTQISEQFRSGHYWQSCQIKEEQVQVSFSTKQNSRKK